MISPSASSVASDDRVRTKNPRGREITTVSINRLREPERIGGSRLALLGCPHLTQSPRQTSVIVYQPRNLVLGRAAKSSYRVCMMLYAVNSQSRCVISSWR